jgi:hypothetical protein
MFTKSPSGHINLRCKFVTSLQIKRNPYGRNFQISWLIEFFKRGIPVDSVYFLYLLLVSIYNILASFQPPYDLNKHAGPV